MHQERQTTTLTETEATRLETAIAQAVTKTFGLEGSSVNGLSKLLSRALWWD